MTQPHSSFEIFEEIGRGEDTIVYRAYDLHLGRDVAIKELKESVAADPRRREQFLSQAKFLAQFDHPAILRVHSVVPQQGWIVMDLMKGSLAAQISHAALPPETVRSILCQLLPALESLHASGKLHGSIRPSNILIDDTGRVKLSDFEASNYDGELVAPSDTKKYLAPELIRSDFGDIGPATDLYCLAFTALELLAGPSFEASVLSSAAAIDADIAWLRLHSSEEPFAAKSKLLKRVPDDLAQTLDKLLSKRVEDRCADASAALALLNEQEVVPVSVVPIATTTGDTVELPPEAMLPASVREVEPPQGPYRHAAADAAPHGKSNARGAAVAATSVQAGARRTQPSASQASKTPATTKDRVNEFLGRPYVLYPLCAFLLLGALGIGFALQGDRETDEPAKLAQQNAPEEADPIVTKTDTAAETDTAIVTDAAIDGEQVVAVPDESLEFESTAEPAAQPEDTLLAESEPVEPAEPVEATEPTQPEGSEQDDPASLALEETTATEPEEPMESAETPAEQAVATEEKIETPQPLTFPQLEFVSTKIDIDGLLDEIKGSPELVIDPGAYISEISDLAISPDGRLLAAAGGKVVRIWELASGRLLDTLRGDRDRTSYGNCEAVEFTPDGQHLVVGVNDYEAHGAIRVYSLDQLDEIEALLPGHTAPVRKLSFSRDGRWMSSADADGHVAIWDWPQRTIVKKVPPRQADQPIFDELQFAGNEPVLAGIDFQGPLLLSVPELRRLGANDPLPSELHAWIVDVLSRQLNYPWNTQNDPRNMDFRLEHQQWAAAGQGNEGGRNRFWVGVWQARKLDGPASPDPETVYSQHKWRVTSVDLAPEHQLVASGDKFGEIHVWNSTTGETLHQFVGQGYPIYEAAFERDGGRIAFGTTPYKPDRWNRNNFGDAEYVLDLAQRSILPVRADEPLTLSQEQTQAGNVQIRASRTADQANMRVEKLVGGRPVSQYDLTTGRNPTVMSLLDEAHLGVTAPVIVADDLGLLGLWDSDRDELKRAFVGHEGMVTSVSRSENGQMILSGSTDRTIRIWRLDDYRPTGTFDFKFENSVVTRVIPGSSSAQAGVQAGDKILSINGLSLSSLFRQMLAGKLQMKPGDVVPVELEREGRPLKYDAQLVEGYDFAEPVLNVYVGNNFEWIIWTPRGYYDASPGAEDLIGWHVNRGPDKSARYFDVQHFREQLNRPDIIDRILQGETVNEAVAGANAVIDENDFDFRSPSDFARIYPPEMDILSPKRGSEVSDRQVQLQAKISSRNGLPISEVTILINGEAAQVLKPTPAQSQQFDVDMLLDITTGHNDIELVATNTAGTSSFKGTYVTANFDAQDGLTRQTVEKRRNLNVLAIGISDYQRSREDFTDLPLAASDARVFAQAARDQANGKLYAETRVKLLTDADATRSACLDGLQWLVDTTESGDSVAIFIAAHGFVDSSQNFYVGTHDVELERPRATAVPWSELIRTLHEDLPQCRRMVFLDLQPTEQAVAPSMRNPLLDLASPNLGTIFFSTNSLQQTQLPTPTGPRGFLTDALLATLSDPTADVDPTPPDALLNATEFSTAWTNAVRALTDNRTYPVSFSPDASRQLNLLQLNP